MSRNSQYIKTYVELLLANDLVPVKSAHQYLPYHYQGERIIYQDPILPGKEVVVVQSQYDEHGVLSSGHPNVIQEANNYIEGLKAAAHSLIAKDNIDKTEQRKEIINQLAIYFKNIIAKEIPEDEAIADLFSSKTSHRNSTFLKRFSEIQDHLKLFTQIVAKKSKHNAKDLDNEGHLLRSINRATQVHRFKMHGTENGEEQFIIYIPCGRYTKRQQALMGKPESVERDHDTTSHNRQNMVLGNSSMVRMIVGTRHVDGSATIHHDSFSGPGARMPYADFKGANEYKTLALKAITLINQEEIIQTLAQRKIDRMTDLELWEGIPLDSRLDIQKENRSALMSQYLAYNRLSVTECYSQVISAGQKIAHENQKEQFKYVQLMMDVLDGAEVTVSIQTGIDNEVDAVVGYQARMSSWGVNWFRHDGPLNPLADSSITEKQNTRFINQMTSDAIIELQKIAVDLTDYQDIDDLFNLLRNPNVLHLTSEIQNAENNLSTIKLNYREALFTYYEKYKNGDEKLDDLKNTIQGYEQGILDGQNEIYRLHSEIQEKRIVFYNAHKERINNALAALEHRISPLIQNNNADKATQLKLQHFYNTSAYLTQAQALYYGNTWHEAQNNFKLQTLTSLLAVELDYANTKGCKSNNDRGQRLAQKIAGNVLWTATSKNGLHTGEFLDHRRTRDKEVHPIEQLDRELTTIQVLHHTANTSVSGGKFDIQDKENFADNGLWGKIASFAKVKNMMPESAWTQDKWWKLGIGLSIGTLAGAGVATAMVLIPPLGAVLGGSIATSATIGGTATLGTVSCGSYVTGTICNGIKNWNDEKSVLKSIASTDFNEVVQPAKEELQLKVSHHLMHQKLNVSPESQVVNEVIAPEFSVKIMVNLAELNIISDYTPENNSSMEL